MAVIPIVFLSKNPSLFDEKISIIIKELAPIQNYTFLSKTKCGSDLFVCFSLYTSNKQGIIDLSMHNSFGGYYKGIEPMGLFWAMKAHPEDKKSKRLLKRDVTTPLIINISVYENWFENIQALNQTLKEPVKSFQVTRMYMGPGVRRIEVKESTGLIGTLFLPAGSGPFPEPLANKKARYKENSFYFMRICPSSIY